MSAAADDMILATAKVSISKTLVRIDGVTYPVNGIGGVFVRRPRIVGLLLAALFLGGMGVSGLTQNSGDSGNAVALLLASAMVLAYAMTRPSVLMLRTASRDQKALRSRNGAALLAVKRAIEEAVTRHG